MLEKVLGEIWLKVSLRMGPLYMESLDQNTDLNFLKTLKNVKIFCGDVRNSSIFKKILRQSEIDKRPISGLVNNAGIRQRKKFSQITKKN